MVLRVVSAFDNEAVTVHSSSPFLTAGTPIINNSDTPVGTIFEFSSGFPYQPIIIDDTGGGSEQFDDDSPNNHIVVDGKGFIANGTGVESESRHFIQALDANGSPTGPTITLTVFSQGGVMQDVWAMHSSIPLDENTLYVKTGGLNFGTSDWDDLVPCFTSGTMIMTQSGEVPIERLQAGDSILTRDNGLKDLIWIGSRSITRKTMAQDPRLCPYVLPPGVMGERGLLLSPNHRVLQVDTQGALSFGADETLVAAKFLAHLPGVVQSIQSEVTYYHLLFDQHEVIMSNGIWTESFLPGEIGTSAFGEAQCQEILSIFPNALTEFVAARRILTRREALILG